jgi:hypothetical protein
MEKLPIPGHIRYDSLKEAIRFRRFLSSEKGTWNVIDPSDSQGATAFRWSGLYAIQEVGNPW